MIELAYFLPSVRKLNLFHLRHLSLGDMALNPIHHYMAETLSNSSLTWHDDHLAYIRPNLKFSRIYLGNEFCDQLIPSESDLTSIHSLCENSGMALTLVTPPVSIDGAHKIQKLVSVIQAQKMAIELVVNDYGVLNLCVGMPSIRPVMGRLLAKQTQFTRFDGVPTHPTGLTTRQWPQRHGASDPEFMNHLTQKYHLSRVEFDLSRQGFLYPPGVTPLPTSVYFPWVVVSTQRVCPIGHSHLPDHEPTPAHPKCQFQCQQFNEVVESLSGERSRLLFQKGTTLFELVKPEYDVFDELEKTAHLDRIIFQPSLPF